MIPFQILNQLWYLFDMGIRILFYILCIIDFNCVLCLFIYFLLTAFYVLLCAQNPEDKRGFLSNQEKKGKPATANFSSSLESLADRSEKDEVSKCFSHKDAIA